MAKSQTEAKTMDELTYTDKDGNDIVISPNPEWVNYGDVNPEPHGGIFVRAERDMWHVVETVSGELLPEGFADDDETLIQESWVEPQDLFIKGDPNNGPTDRFKDVIESFLNISGYENALVDYDIEYFVVDFANFHHSMHDEIVSDYWEGLEKYDIKKEDF